MPCPSPTWSCHVQPPPFERPIGPAGRGGLPGPDQPDPRAEPPCPRPPDDNGCCCRHNKFNNHDDDDDDPNSIPPPPDPYRLSVRSAWNIVLPECSRFPTLLYRFIRDSNREDFIDQVLPRHYDDQQQEDEAAASGVTTEDAQGPGAANTTKNKSNNSKKKGKKRQQGKRRR
jgi:hypothetical protein